MNTVKTTSRLTDVWKTVLARGLLTVILGAAVLVWPDKSVAVAAVSFGVFLVVSGSTEIVLAFTPDINTGTRALLFIGGALSLVLGVLAFRDLERGYATWLMAIWIGVGFVFAGVAEVALAIEESGIPDRGWLIFTGVLGMIAGVVVLLWPFASISVLAIVVGIWLVILGIAEIVWAVRAHKAITEAEQARKPLTSSRR
ncbi:MAG: HdeD family acid-resistance protein [Mycolicibacterium sp.]|nr:HdeD family acid-resistance protein [Mycolicibacterium sp.]